MNNNYKDSQGRYRTLSLFREFYREEMPPVYTLKEYDIKFEDRVLPSAHNIYMKCADPTEYNFAIKLVGSWDHWQKIIANVQIFEYVSRWRKELEVKLRSKAIQAITYTAFSEGAKGTTAATYIAEYKWENRAKRGRPTSRNKLEQSIQQEIKSDLQKLKRIK